MFPEVVRLYEDVCSMRESVVRKLRYADLMKKCLCAIMSPPRHEWVSVKDVELVVGSHYVIRVAWGPCKYHAETRYDPPCLAEWINDGWFVLHGNLSHAGGSNKEIQVLTAVGKR